MALAPALFLDRDGVINIDHGYVHSPQDCEFIEGIFSLCRTATAAGLLVVIITNQAGIGRGYYTEREFLEFMDWMKGAFKTEGAVIDGVYYCPYHPEYGRGEYKQDSSFRKPAPGMILHAAQKHSIDLSRSLLIGDKETDIEAGISAGVGKNILLTTLDPDLELSTRASIVVSSLSQVEVLISTDFK